MRLSSGHYEYLDARVGPMSHGTLEPWKHHSQLSWMASSPRLRNPWGPLGWRLTSAPSWEENPITRKLVLWNPLGVELAYDRISHSSNLSVFFVDRLARSMGWRRLWHTVMLLWNVFYLPSNLSSKDCDSKTVGQINKRTWAPARRGWQESICANTRL